MSAGTVSRIVRTHGSAWGRIQPEGEDREIFFNAGSLLQPELFTELEVGEQVEFLEQRDLANGTRASRVSTKPGAAVSRP